MADRGDTHYHVRTLNRWFAWSSLALLVATFWMVIDDWNRPWKGYQKRFRSIEAERAQAELQSPEAQASIEEEARLSRELAETEAGLASRRGELDAAERELADLEHRAYIATEAEKKLKQQYNWERFVTEEYLIHHGEGEGYRAKLANLEGYEDRLAEASGTKQAADAAVLAQQKTIDEMRAGVLTIEAEMKAATRNVDLVRKKLASLAPQDVPTKVANLVRDFPGLDFIGPNLKVQKVMPPNLTFELNFTQKQRIDMCQTCHLAVDRAGFEEEAQPFRTHPRPDLFLSAKSPHPSNQMGCTICHRGSGESLDFQRVDHAASDDEEGERWHGEYGWHKQHYWDYPMLSSDFVEAGCVQCHKTSMDLIASEAPRVSEGFQLFERYGCYACHKVDWFPTTRRPGPTLAKILEKTRPEFIQAWITDPKSFRPTTWMPQIFHLENYAPDVTVATSEYGQGREMKGDEWSDTAIAAVAAFVGSRSATEPLPPIPVEGDATRGREVFRLSGCLACHNVAPFTEEARAETLDPAEQLRDTNEHGPNLRGVATKVNPEWLYAWIRDPKAYWAETRMPDLRLSEQDAADIVAYVFDDPDGAFHDVPEGWAEGERPYERDVLEEQARWFFNRTLRSELAARFQGEWKDDRALLAAVGEKWVLNQGCHSCHEIPGLETAQPIGTELSTWGSKTIDKLDFGFLPEILAHEEGWDHHREYEFEQYRENFLTWKLRNPRIYDRDKVKNPTERLRMPLFALSEDQIKSIATFVVGLVNDEVPHARMVPTPEKAAMDRGLRVVRQKNCAACHVIEPGTIEFLDEDGHPHAVRGQFQIVEDELLPPPMAGFSEYLADYIEYMREEDPEYELEEVAAQLLEPVPGMGDVGTTFTITNLDSIRTKPAWGGDVVPLIVDYYLRPGIRAPSPETEDQEGTLTGDGTGKVQDVDGEWRDFTAEVYEKLRWTYAPPVLIGEGAKLQREWFYRFLLEPVPLREQIRVRMPTFDWDEGEAEAVADLFAERARLEWPKTYARKLLLALGKTPAEVAGEMAAMKLSGSSQAQIEGILEGRPVETAAGIANLKAYGDANGFSISPSVAASYEPIVQRTPSNLDPLLAQAPDFYDKVHALVSEQGGPNCVSCHFLAGDPPTNEAPVGWAPDLAHTRERLRPDWLRDWLTDPSRIYPGTTMPANFDRDEQWQSLYPAPAREQIEAVITWLFNLDRALIRN
jgi:cytochrome c2